MEQIDNPEIPTKVPTAGRPAYYVVLDTNVLVFHTDLLCDPLASALLHALKETEGCIALPAILEEEVLKHAVEVGRKANASMGKAIRKLEAFGNVTGYFTPLSDRELRAAAEKRLATLMPDLERVPWTPNHLEKALLRVMDESPPNAPGNQQFKDSVIWEAICDLADKADVYFITADKAFYEEKTYRKGLSYTLKAGIEKKGHAVHLHSEVVECLLALSRDMPHIAVRGAIGAIDAAALPLVAEGLGCFRLSLGQLDSEASKVAAFPLGESNAVAVRFHLSHRCQRMLRDGNTIQGFFHIFGACKVVPSQATASNVHVHHTDFNSPEDGEGIVWLRVTNERGGPGPLPVTKEQYWIVNNKTDDGCEYYYRDEEAERFWQEREDNRVIEEE